MTNRKQWVYRIRGLLMLPPAIFIVLFSYGEFEKDALVWPIGLAIFAAGMALRIWAQMHLHYRLRVHKKLTITGPYVYVRNPIYIANTLLMLGLTVTSELAWFLPIMLLWCIVLYRYVVRTEEAHLLEKYGEPYGHFIETVPRWIPKIGKDRSAKPRVAGFFWSSVAAELHCLLWLIPLIGKELIL